MTQALLLCAGRGERLRPLTDHRPKPLVKVAGDTLLGCHLARLRSAGVTRVVINLGWLGEQIIDHVGDGARWGVEVIYSAEGYPTLDTGGAILRAMHWLDDAPFWVINADVWTDYALPGSPSDVLDDCEGALGLVANPQYRDCGDFDLVRGRVINKANPGLTFSGIAAYRPAFFPERTVQRCSVVPWLRAAADNDALAGFKIAQAWFDVGTPDRLETLAQYLEETGYAD
ncbi:MAG: nucleotidyltransferase family protein [Pseudomonadota bacterium]